MSRNRLEAFSDGVVAILITIMVLELRVQHVSGEHTLAELEPIRSRFLAYVLSFVYLGIYWNNHHHMLHLVDKVTGGILWANLHLLFWLSLVPAATAWMGDSDFDAQPMAVYGGVLLLSAIAYTLLQARIIRVQGNDSRLRLAVGNDTKGRISMLAYLLAIPLGFVDPWIGGGLYVFVALLWLVPDRRIERLLQGERQTP
jgi:uncharacterized membrane protein